MKGHKILLVLIDVSLVPHGALDFLYGSQMPALCSHFPSVELGATTPHSPGKLS